MIGSTNTAQNGFTVVELLIATAVMSIVMVLASNLLILFFRSQDTSRDKLYLEAEVRQIFSRIAETSRQGRIDYDFYAAEPSAEPDFLAFRDSYGSQTVYQFFGLDGFVSVYVCTTSTLNDSCDKTVDPSADAAWAQMNDESTNFPIHRFTGLPDDPPYLRATTTDVSPVVTVVMQLELSGTSSVSPVLQTSLTPRLYAR